MKQRLLQKFANSIIKRLEMASDDEMFYFYIEMGTWFNSFCVNYFDIYLD